MIQRIQTLYLLLVLILSGITLFSVQAGFVGNADAIHYVLNYKGIFSGVNYVQNVWALSALCVLIPIIALITIFLYKKRILQIRLSIINSVLLAGYYGLLFIYLWQAGNVLNADWYLNIVTAFPLINIILTFLAIRAIGKDEALIKSLNRLR
jgi:hypothetical protein